MLDEFTAQGASLYGVSCDAIWSQKAFAEKLGVSIPFLSDFEPKGAATRAFGIDRGLPFPLADVGDRLAGTTEGPLDYTRFGGYVLQATTLGEHVPGALPRETTAPAAPDRLSVGTYNVENLFAGDDPAKFARLAAGVVTNIIAIDVRPQPIVMRMMVLRAPIRCSSRLLGTSKKK